jgi:hypothetical protein
MKKIVSIIIKNQTALNAPKIKLNFNDNNTSFEFPFSNVYHKDYFFYDSASIIENDPDDTDRTVEITLPPQFSIPPKVRTYIEKIVTNNENNPLNFSIMTLTELKAFYSALSFLLIPLTDELKAPFSELFIEHNENLDPLLTLDFMTVLSPVNSSSEKVLNSPHFISVSKRQEDHSSSVSISHKSIAKAYLFEKLAEKIQGTTKEINNLRNSIIKSNPKDLYWFYAAFKEHLLPINDEINAILTSDNSDKTKKYSINILFKAMSRDFNENSIPYFSLQFLNMDIPHKQKEWLICSLYNASETQLSETLTESERDKINTHLTSAASSSTLNNCFIPYLNILNTLFINSTTSPFNETTLTTIRSHIVDSNHSIPSLFKNLKKFYSTLEGKLTQSEFLIEEKEFLKSFLIKTNADFQSSENMTLDQYQTAFASTFNNVLIKENSECDIIFKNSINSLFITCTSLTSACLIDHIPFIAQLINSGEMYYDYERKTEISESLLQPSNPHIKLDFLTIRNTMADYDLLYIAPLLEALYCSVTVSTTQEVQDHLSYILTTIEDERDDQSMTLECLFENLFSNATPDLLTPEFIINATQQIATSQLCDNEIFIGLRALYNFSHIPKQDIDLVIAGFEEGFDYEDKSDLIKILNDNSINTM